MVARPAPPGFGPHHSTPPRLSELPATMCHAVPPRPSAGKPVSPYLDPPSAHSALAPPGPGRTALSGRGSRRLTPSRLTLPHPVPPRPSSQSRGVPGAKP